MRLHIDARSATTLLAIARDSVRHGLAAGKPLPVDATLLGGALADPAGSFVTLYHRRALRGCVGNLAADVPLAAGVARNAFHAAFGDRRFAPLSADELPDMALEISVLSVPETMEVASESELRRRLVPGVDGVILSEGALRATFLPKVWEQLPEPSAFLGALKRKAGLPEHYWSGTLRIERYQATVIADG